MPENKSTVSPSFDDIIAAIRRFAETAKDFISLQKFFVDLIADKLPYYNWVGFYMLDRSDEDVLVLGRFTALRRSIFGFLSLKASAEQRSLTVKLSS